MSERALSEFHFSLRSYGTTSSVEHVAVIERAVLFSAVTDERFGYTSSAMHSALEDELQELYRSCSAAPLINRMSWGWSIELGCRSSAITGCAAVR